MTRIAEILIRTIIIFLTTSGVHTVWDEYVNKTEKTREELIDTGYYFPNTIFGSANPQSPEVRSLEYYIPLSSRIFHGNRVNIWPTTFEKHLVRMNKPVLELTQFILHTKKANDTLNDKGELLEPSDLSTVKRSSWNVKENIIILIHGYRQNVHTKNMPQQLKDAYLEVNRTENILLVNWGRMAFERNYFESAMYSQKVGRYLGDFLIILRNAKLIDNFYQIHMIGLGLGAQVAAAAAKYMKNRGGGLPVVRRITGLDPTLPGFTHRTDLYLDQSDAEYVDIIHTNGGEQLQNGEFGFFRPIGHSDFYPNGGVQQPICGRYGRVGDLICKRVQNEAELFRALKYLLAITGKLLTTTEDQLLEKSFARANAIVGESMILGHVLAKAALLWVNIWYLCMGNTICTCLSTLCLNCSSKWKTKQRKTPEQFYLIFECLTILYVAIKRIGKYPNQKWLVSSCDPVVHCFV